MAPAAGASGGARPPRGRPAGLPPPILPDMATTRARARSEASKRPGAESAFPRVRVATGAAFELIAQLAAFASGPARASLGSGKRWIREVRRLAGPELSRRAESNSLALYAELAPIALATEPPHDVDQLLDGLRGMPPEALRHRLLGAAAPPNQAMVSSGAFDRAIEGDAAALAELLAAMGVNRAARTTMTRLATAPPAETKAAVVDLVTAWATSVYPAFAEAANEVVRRDVEARRRRLEHADPRAAVREALNGVELHPGPWVEEIVLVPTVAMRPFVIPI